MYTYILKIIYMIFTSSNIFSFCQFTFDLCVDVTGVVCHQFGLLGIDLHAMNQC